MQPPDEGLSLSTQIRPNAQPPAAFKQAIKDEEMATWLKEKIRENHTIGLLYSGHHCKVFDEDSPPCHLITVDPDKESAKQLRKFAVKGRLKILQMDRSVLAVSEELDQSWSLCIANKDTLDDYLNQRNILLGRSHQGRGEDINQATAWRVWTDAGGCCMYRGCGKDLSQIRLYNKSAKVGYLAHIVASNPDGPRGDATLSHRLSNVHDNIMLMCDEHHRLIDAIDEDVHPTPKLQEMRQEHVRLVNILRLALSYKRTTAVTLFGNVANVPTYFSDTDLNEALLEQGKILAHRIDCIPRDTHRDERTAPEFWKNLLYEHDHHIRNMVTMFSSGKVGLDTDLSFFPLHLMPILVLGGRIMGEGRPIDVFQYRRHLKSWTWDPHANPLPPETFAHSVQQAADTDELLLSLELTAELDPNALPTEIQDKLEKGQMHWWRISLSEPNGDCIKHPDDLAQFRTIARCVINQIQDGLRPSRIHLIAIAPASTCFTFGQMLQAGHHPSYIVYDRPNHTTPFRAALTIEGAAVSSADYATTPHCIPLR